MREYYNGTEIGWKFKEASSSAELLLLLKKFHTSMEQVCWLYIFRNQHFTNKIFDEYKKEIPWKYIATSREIPEKYLNEFIEEVDLYEISCFLPLSVNFIKKYYHILSIDCLVSNERLNKEARAYVQKLYQKVKDLPSYHKRWDTNLSDNKTFCPKNFKGHYSDYDDHTPFPTHTLINLKAQEPEKQNIISKTKPLSEPKKSTKKVERDPAKKYLNKTKAELKKILEKRKVRVYYHDTLEILRKKCVESEEKK